MVKLTTLLSTKNQLLPCTAPSDYTATSVDLTFTPGVNSLTVSVPIIDNGILEDTEQFFGDLNTSDPDVNLMPSGANITITDDDGINALQHLELHVNVHVILLSCCDWLYS